MGFVTVLAISVGLTFLLLDRTGCAMAGSSIVAFDCHDPKSSTWTVSLLTTPECADPKDPETTTTVNIQLVQKSRFRQVQFLQCYIKRTTVVRGCGALYDYTWEMPGGYDESILSVPRDVCERFHRVMSFEYWGMKIDKLESNGTVKDFRIAAGELKSNGDCSGGSSYKLNGRVYNDVIAQEFYEVGLFSGYASVDLDANRIHLPSGVTTKYTDGEVMDLVRGQTIWVTTETECIRSRYDVLYQGIAKKSEGFFGQQQRVVITVEQPSVMFALELMKPTFVCAAQVYETEHPQLFIYISTHGDYIFPHTKLSPQNIDFSAYVNTKFVYVEKHIRGQINTLYRDLLIQKCKVERMALNNLLTLALVSEDEFAYTYMEKPGYTSIVRGEVAHVIRCAPVPVSLARSERCYKEVPVSYQNKTHYLSPRNRLLQKTGTEVECHPLLPVLFSFDEKWYSVYPKPVLTVTPNILRPLTEQTFSYQSPENLATSGLYTKEDLDSYQRAVIFSGETSAAGQSMTRAYMGQDVDLSHGHFENLLTPAATQSISAAVIGGVFGWATYFGNWVSAIIGAWFFVKVLLIILNWTMNCYSLHQTFGPSRYMLASFWDSLTHHLVITRKTARPEIGHSAVEATAPIETASEAGSTAATPKQDVPPPSISGGFHSSPMAPSAWLKARLLNQSENVELV
nr:MAG: putative glycoprotein [Sanya chuvirus 2]